MSDSPDDAADEPAMAVSATLAEQMLHLTNRFEQERLKLEARTFWPEEDAIDEG